jgi:excisionase family DNA binding protein
VTTSFLEFPAVDRLFTVDALADYLGVSPKTIYDWRLKRTGPAAMKVGNQLRWRRADVEAWLDAQKAR